MELKTLPEDINRVLEKGAEISEENLQLFLKNIEQLMRQRLKPEERSREFTLRFSKLGTPDRKLWYESRFETAPETNNLLKFLYGDLIEQLVLFLAKTAGHKVENEQKEFEIEGVLGHQDATIDGVTVDVKSTSNFAFKKFKLGTLSQNDPFGYVAQLSGYRHAAGTDRAAFLAVNKETGEIVILETDPIDEVDPVNRIKKIRQVLDRSAPPEEKCYQPEPHGKSGNLMLNKNCTYCPFKTMCWSHANGGMGLRNFKYSTGIVSLVEVVETPRVEEVFSIGGDNDDESD